METLPVLVFLAIAMVVLELLQLFRRGVAGYRGYLVLLLGDFLLLGWAIQEHAWSGWQGWGGLIGAVVLVILPPIVDTLMRRALRRDQLGRAAEWAALKELLMPGRATTAEREYLTDLSLVDRGRADEVLHRLRGRLVEADNGDAGVLQERIITILVAANRYREAAVHYEAHFAGDHPALHSAAAVHMVRAYGELGDLAAAARLVEQLDEVVARGDLSARGALVEALLLLLAFVGAADAIDGLLATPLLKRAVPLALRNRLADIMTRRSAAAAPPASIVGLARSGAQRLQLQLRSADLPQRRHAWATIGLITANLLVYLLLTRVGRFEDGYDLVRDGASFHAAVRLGEWWRLATAMFLHDGTNYLHITLNLLTLYVFGRQVEPVFGWLRFLVVYLVAGLAGNLASVVMSGTSVKAVMSLGSSGAVFGLVAALLVVIAWHAPDGAGGKQRRSVWRDPWRRAMLVNLLVLSALQLYFGAIVPVIDNWAHAGGFAGGGVAAWLLLPSGVVGRHRAARVGAVAALALLLAFVGGSTVAAARERVDETLAKIPLRSFDVGPVRLISRAYAFRYQPRQGDWPDQWSLADPVAEIDLSPHILPLENGDVMAVLRRCLERDRETLRRLAGEGRETGTAALEDADAPPIDGWHSLGARARGLFEQRLLYFGRVLDGGRVLVVELQVLSSERHRELRDREIARLLGSVEVVGNASGQ